MGAQNNEIKDLSNLVGANLLDHYLESNKAQLEKVIELEGEITFDPDASPKEFILNQLTKLHELVGLLSGNPNTRRSLRMSINKVIWDVKDPYFYQPLYDADMTAMVMDITTAIEGNFGRKEDVQLKALLVILSKVSLLRENALIPQKFMRMMEREENL
jgi:hypothetical protein